jgi:hypothetical protein
MRMSEKSFVFELGQQVIITVSGEIGEVVGRAEYSTAESNYYLRYKSPSRGAVEAWWTESARASAPVATEISQDTAAASGDSAS